MKFDLSKVGSAINAEDFKSKSLILDNTNDCRDTATGWFADSLVELKNKVDNDDYVDALEEVITTSKKPFIANLTNRTHFAFFYPKEKEYRPYKSGNELFEDFKKRFNESGVIWVKDTRCGYKSLITELNEADAVVGIAPLSYKALFHGFTYLDGSPCGIEE